MVQNLSTVTKTVNRKIMKLKIKTLIKFIICLGIASGISLLIFFYEAKFSTSENFYSTSRRLCDGFFISGIIFLTLGILIFCANKGGYNFLSYTFYSIKFLFSNKSSKKNLSENHKKTYFDYCAKKNTNKKSSPIASIFCGIFFIILSVIVYFAFYK